MLLSKRTQCSAVQSYSREALLSAAASQGLEYHGQKRCVDLRADAPGLPAEPKTSSIQTTETTKKLQTHKTY